MFPTEGCDYLAVKCYLTANQSQGVGQGTSSTAPALFGVDLSSPVSVYELVSLAPGQKELDGVSVNGYEVAFSVKPGELRIVDIRRDFTSNSVQTLTYSADDEDDEPYNCFHRTSLSATYAAAECYTVAGEGAFVACVWDRATGKCIRKFPYGSLAPGLLCGSRVVTNQLVEGDGYWYISYDLSDSAAPDVRICEDYEYDDSESQFSGDALFRFSFDDSLDSQYRSISVYNLQSGE